MKPVRVLMVTLLFLLATGVGVASSAWAAAGSNDYPFKNDPRTCDSASGCTSDGYGFYIKQCTSFVAWRLRSVNGYDLRGPIGSGAMDWGVVYKSITDSTPSPGAVAWSSANHVAWVWKVDGSNVTVEEYNYGHPNAYGTRTVPASTFTGYIHFKDLALPTSAKVTVSLNYPTTGIPINTTPRHAQRALTIQILNTNGQVVLDRTVTANHASGRDDYTATLSLGSGWKTGYYQVKLRLDYTLRRLVPGILTITNGSSNVIPTTALWAGDFNQDNVLNILDYNMLMDCYSDISPPRGPCDAAKKRATDLTDDGAVNQYDYNFLLKFMQNSPPA